MKTARSAASDPVEAVDDYTRVRAPKLLNVVRLERLMADRGIDILVASTPEMTIQSANGGHQTGTRCR